MNSVSSYLTRDSKERPLHPFSFLLVFKMRLSPALASILFLVHVWGTAADTVPCPNPALLSGDLVTITSGQTAWSVSSAVAGAALLGGQVTAPVNTTAKWLIEAQGLSSHPTGYVFA
ncbi:hypothetical protein K438DRAFT_1873382 [Mycena galopus ATCC 62051]|nr:hypothetical protein K438DRAFT_1873382 [Mycena galopus ATCC 62051]